MVRRAARSPRKRSGGFGCCGCIFGCLTSALVLSILVALGCVLGLQWLVANAPQPPQANFTPSNSLSNMFDNKMATADAIASSTRSFSISLTEAEVSSWLNLGANEVAYAGLPVNNLQVTFRNGQASLYGDLNFLGLETVGMSADFGLKLTTGGRVEVEITEAKFGSLSLPESYRENISNTIQAGIDNELREIDRNYRITFLSLSDGRLNLQGTLN